MSMSGQRDFEGARTVGVRGSHAVQRESAAVDIDVQRAARRSQRGQADDIRRGSRAAQRAGDGQDGAAVHEAAAHGIAGSGGALPHLDAIQRSFGPHDVSGVQAHVGGEAAEASAAMGARAYATGDDVAFARSPDLHTAAHEAAHVVQQRGGVSLKGGVGQAGDPYERHADAVADRVVQGESAVDLLDSMAGGGGAQGDVQTRAVQRFSDVPAVGMPDSKGAQHWVAPGKELRVTDDGTVAVAQDSIAGSQEMYLLASRLAPANAELKKTQAPFELKAGGGSVKGSKPSALDAGPMLSLDRVTPVEAASLGGLTIPDDCGQAAHAVTGAATENKRLKADYTDKDGKPGQAQQTDPEVMKYEIMVAYFADEITDADAALKTVQEKLTVERGLRADLKPYLKSFKAARKALLAAKNEVDAAGQAVLEAKSNAASAVAVAGLRLKLAGAITRYRVAVAELMALEASDINGRTLREVIDEYLVVAGEHRALTKLLMGPYEKLDDVEKEAFDQKAGINRHANPEIGEAYTISTGGPTMPGAGMTWNFHWGGVMLKSTTGSDNVTLENYAGSPQSAWKIQVYGVPSKGDERRGQTFHEQHRDTHRQHGQSPTTMSTSKT